MRSMQVYYSKHAYRLYAYVSYVDVVKIDQLFYYYMRSMQVYYSKHDYRLYA